MVDKRIPGKIHRKSSYWLWHLSETKKDGARGREHTVHNSESHVDVLEELPSPAAEGINRAPLRLPPG
jgi:hypothetical protein